MRKTRHEHLIPHPPRAYERKISLRIDQSWKNEVNIIDIKEPSTDQRYADHEILSRVSRSTLPPVKDTGQESRWIFVPRSLLGLRPCIPLREVP